MMKPELIDCKECKHYRSYKYWSNLLEKVRVKSKCMEQYQHVERMVDCPDCKGKVSVPEMKKKIKEEPKHLKRIPKQRKRFDKKNA